MIAIAPPLYPALFFSNKGICSDVSSGLNFFIHNALLPADVPPSMPSVNAIAPPEIAAAFSTNLVPSIRSPFPAKQKAPPFTPAAFFSNSHLSTVIVAFFAGGQYIAPPLPSALQFLNVESPTYREPPSAVFIHIAPPFSVTRQFSKLHPTIYDEPLPVFTIPLLLVEIQFTKLTS